MSAISDAATAYQNAESALSQPPTAAQIANVIAALGTLVGLVAAAGTHLSGGDAAVVSGLGGLAALQQELGQWQTVADLSAGTTTGAPGKYIKIAVPNFNIPTGTTSTTPGLTSYLRIGAVENVTTAGTVTMLPRGTLDGTGEDLASLVHGFTDDMRKRSQFIADVPATPGTPDTYDSDGNLIPGDPPTPDIPAHTPTAPALSDASGTSLDTTDARRQESALLHTKGGWRDHSDGNRISTTRGDKIEVIRGNYKLLVLGRSDPPKPVPTPPPNPPPLTLPATPGDWSNVAGMEISGGQLDTAGGDLAYGALPDVMTPVATDGSLPAPSDPTRDLSQLDASPPAPFQMLETTYEWNQNIDGTWGWKQTTNVGSPFPTPDPITAHGQTLGNTEIVTNTWVDSQENNLGSSTNRVKKLLSTTYAVSMTQITDADTIGNHTNASTSIDNSTTVTGTINNATAAEAINNATAALAILDWTAVGAVQVNAQAVGANLTANVFGLGAEIDVAMMLSQLIVCLTTVNTTWVTPLVNDTHCSIHNDLHSGVHVDHHAGMHFDIHDGIHASFDLNPITINDLGELRVAGEGTSTVLVDTLGHHVASHMGEVHAAATQVIHVAATYLTS